MRPEQSSRLLHALGRVYTMLRQTVTTEDDRIQPLVQAMPRILESLEFEGVSPDDYILILFGIYGPAFFT